MMSGLLIKKTGSTRRLRVFFTGWMLLSLFFISCMKNIIPPDRFTPDDRIRQSWVFPENDVFIDLPVYSHAFFETSEEGHLTGSFVVKLPGDEKFSPQARSLIQVNDLPEGIVPEITISKGRTMAVIRLGGKASAHSAKDSTRIGIVFPRACFQEEKHIPPEGLQYDGIPVYFHDVVCEWRSPKTGKVYHLVFNDEFNGKQIDSKRWTYRKDYEGPVTRTIRYNGTTVDIMVENEASVLTGGDLRLAVYKKTSEKNKIFTGGINTVRHFLPRYGYFETRVSFRDCRGFGYWPAFWIYFLRKDKNTTGTEIDVLEYLPAEKKICQTLHWYIDGKHYSRSSNFVLQAPEEYHCFGLEWTPDDLMFYVDGHMMLRLSKKDDPKYVPSAYQMVYFSMSAGTWGGNVADTSNRLPAYSRFDYCRVYQTGDEDAYYFLGDEKIRMKATERSGKF